MHVATPLVGPSAGSTLQDVAVLCPDIEAAADTAIRAHGLGAADPAFAHPGLDFVDLQDCRIAGLALDSFDDADHGVDRRLGESGHETGVLEHRFFHEGKPRDFHGNILSYFFLGSLRGSILGNPKCPPNSASESRSSGPTILAPVNSFG